MTQGEQLGEQLPSQRRTHGVLQQLRVWVQITQNCPGHGAVTWGSSSPLPPLQPGSQHGLALVGGKVS